MTTKGFGFFFLGMALIISGLVSGCVPLAATSAAATTVQVAHDRRTLGTLVDDKTIEIKAQSKLNKIPEVRDSGHVVITSYNNIVLITGQVPYDYVKDEITNSLTALPRVRRVFNELSIADSSNLKQRSIDSWITTKIKSSLLAEGRIDPTRVKVITENEVVYLLGLVTLDEAETATMIARQTNGVREVIRAFEYL